MTARGKVGKSTSNALRSYNRIINNVTEQCDKYKELSTILGRNIKMAVVYSNKEGCIKYLGDQMFVDIIADKCEDDLLNSSAWEDGDAPKTIERFVLPYLPAPVSRLNAKDMQHIIPNVMRNLRAGGYVKWGKTDSKPVWWPEDIVFANVKQRPEQQSSDDRWVDCLRKVVTNMYGHHGYNVETYVDQENEESVDETPGEENNNSNCVPSDEDADDNDAVVNDADNNDTDNNDADDNADDDNEDSALNVTPTIDDMIDVTSPVASEIVDHLHTPSSRFLPRTSTPHQNRNPHSVPHQNRNAPSTPWPHQNRNSPPTPHQNRNPPSTPHQNRTPHSTPHQNRSPPSTPHQNRNAPPTPRSHQNRISPSMPHQNRNPPSTSHQNRNPPSMSRQNRNPTSTPHQNRNPQSTPTSAPVILPLHFCGKRNWEDTESDPAVRDFISNSPLPKKRRIKPRDIFTPSKYM